LPALSYNHKPMQCRKKPAKRPANAAKSRQVVYTGWRLIVGQSDGAHQ
jgi:hypothetical protein